MRTRQGLEGSALRSGQMIERALIVEAHGTTREAMSRLLKHLGVAVDSAASLADAREKLLAAAAAASPPHCVLIDEQLPDGRGTDLVTDVRAAGAPVRVAIVSGSVEPARAEDV